MSTVRGTVIGVSVFTDAAGRRFLFFGCHWLWPSRFRVYLQRYPDIHRVFVFFVVGVHIDHVPIPHNFRSFWHPMFLYSELNLFSPWMPLAW